jgi:hypothetical protein
MILILEWAALFALFMGGLWGLATLAERSVLHRNINRPDGYKRR